MDNLILASSDSFFSLFGLGFLSGSLFTYFVLTGYNKLNEIKVRRKRD